MCPTNKKCGMFFLYPHISVNNTLNSSTFTLNSS
ncbi:hypothetical protein AB26_5159, partial [Escherichia coli 2-011-08_S1_C2]